MHVDPQPPIKEVTSVAQHIRSEPLRREPRITSTIGVARGDAMDSLSTGAFIAAQAQPQSHSPVPSHQSGFSEPDLRHEVHDPVDAGVHAAAQSSSAAAAAANSSHSVSHDDLSRPIKRPTQSRKIIALRLSAGSARIDGAKLKALLDEAQLRHGKYGIFHRLQDDGATVFSVASMVEPGTFDLQSMPALQFPGVTLFMQLPGAAKGAALFDQLLECARHLEQRMGGLLQDERGLPLTEQRIQRIRDDIADFEHLLGS
jgi:cell division protein ZipA